MNDSPLDVALRLSNKWTAPQISWLVSTVILVFIVHKVATRKIRKQQAGWTHATFWVICIFAWFFAMHVVVWDKIKDGGENSIYILLSAMVAIYVSACFLLRHSKSSGQRRGWWDRIISGAITSIIVFGIIGFATGNHEHFAFAAVMGTIIGFILGKLTFSLYAMFHEVTDEEVTNEDEVPPV